MNHLVTFAVPYQSPGREVAGVRQTGLNVEQPAVRAGRLLYKNYLRGWDGSADEALPYKDDQSA